MPCRVCSRRIIVPAVTCFLSCDKLFLKPDRSIVWGWPYIVPMPLNVSYSLKFALIFGGVSSMAALLMTSIVFVEESWRGLWVFAGLASFVVGYVLSRWLVERRRSPSNSRLVWVGSLIALLSHWLCWYSFLVVTYVRNVYLGESLGLDPVDPLLGLGVACGYTLFSMAFLGWLSLPIAIFLCIWLRRDGQVAGQTSRRDSHN